MKKCYIEPEVKTISFLKTDVLLASDGTDDSSNDPYDAFGGNE